MVSELQKNILETCLDNGGSCLRLEIENKAGIESSKAQKENIKNIINRSIERLIERGYLVGYGSKTKEKLFITSVRITSFGLKYVKYMRKQSQKTLPLKTNKVKKTNRTQKS
jgi:hypothetical protein